MNGESFDKPEASLWALQLTAVYNLIYIYIFLRRMGKKKALAHHTSTYFHTRHVSI